MQLKPPQISQMVNLLLACDSIRDRSIRDDVLIFLAEHVPGAIPRRDQDRADVFSIVCTCAKYPGALCNLLEGVRCFDEGSIPLQKLEAFWQGLVGTSANAAPPPPQANPRQLEDRLCYIDFKQAVATFEATRENLGKGGGAALFLTQQSYAMGSEWFMQRMHGLLREMTYPFHKIEIGFETGMRLDEHGILQRLAEWLAVEYDQHEID
ncbi:effector-associated domain 2-containing protein [Candidatus Viridilinea mediisalina]|uniref:Effector-associated domain-containing protein n=1 Tax=Candidatus Viridilinea mediisalina TaxID=2024553 RepID=A0A2A6RIE4_9CHLR|nr:hypothetical protein [Candidatus Viridilinea mediisalina]PDW02655.1 hypothetical protein CJ255_12885 [Candidatus Viridilinea mediisalina]